MKRLFFVLGMIFVLVFSGCGNKEYPFFNNQKDISSIKIVTVCNPHDNMKIQFAPITVIEDKEVFLNEFSNIKVSRVFGYAYPIEEGSMAIKFEYANGDWELIAVPGPGRIIYSVDDYFLVADEIDYIEKWGEMGKAYYENAKHYNLCAGTITLDSEELTRLVEKYLE